MYSFAICYLCFALSDLQSPDMDVHEVEMRALAGRRAVKQGHIVLDQKTYDDGSPVPTQERITTVWFDGIKLRNDVLLRHQADQPLHREICCKNCERQGEAGQYQVYYSEEKKPQDTILAITMLRMGPGFNLPLFDGRVLGMAVCNSPTLARNHLESFLARPDRKEPSVQRAKWAGKVAWHVTYFNLRGTRIQAWIVPEWDYSVARIEARLELDKTSFVDSIESEYVLDAESSLWFPSVCIYERKVDDQSVEKEVVQVKIQSLNKPLPREVFQLEGMAISPGTPIAGLDEPSGPVYWNGSQIIPEDVKHPGNRVDHSASGTTRWILVITAVGFAILAIALMWRYLSTKKRPS